MPSAACSIRRPATRTRPRCGQSSWPGSNAGSDREADQASTCDGSTEVQWSQGSKGNVNGIGRTTKRFSAQIEDAALGRVLWSPIGVFMPGCDPVQPDVLVIRAEDSQVFQGGRIVGVPALLLEVQSPSYPAYDSRIKREAYARAGVPEYWIVRPASRDVLVCTASDASLGDYARTEQFRQDDELVSPTLPVRFIVAELFAGAPDTTL